MAGFPPGRGQPKARRGSLRPNGDDGHGFAADERWALAAGRFGIPVRRPSSANLKAILACQNAADR
jgi:hypothetical protein